MSFGPREMTGFPSMYSGHGFSSSAVVVDGINGLRKLYGFRFYTPFEKRLTLAPGTGTLTEQHFRGGHDP
jgi:hypothetical protein